MIPTMLSSKKVAVGVLALTLVALGGALLYIVSLPQSSSGSKENAEGVPVQQRPDTRNDPLLGNNLEEALQAINALEELGVE